MTKKNELNIKKRISRFAYTDAHELIQAQQRSDLNNYSQLSRDSFYFRNGSYALATEEKKVGRLINAGKAALTTSGMSAIVTAFEVASLTAGDIVIHGTIEYGHSFDYIAHDLTERKIYAYEIDPGNINRLNNSIKKIAAENLLGKIKVIFFETIGNGPGMPVLDIEKFLSFEILQEINPVIILDNTLATNSIIKLADLIRNTKLKVIGLESATKFYLFNQELGGILFTPDTQLFAKLLNKRKRIGSTPTPSQIKTYAELIPNDKNEFDSNNLRTTQNTYALAKFCVQANGAGKKFLINYPNFSQHPNLNIAEKINPLGIAPLFFITSSDPARTSEQLFYMLEKNKAFENMILTDSFGFKTTTTLFSSRYGGYVRIAGGLEEEGKINQIGNRLKNALENIAKI